MKKLLFCVGLSIISAFSSFGFATDSTCENAFAPIELNQHNQTEPKSVTDLMPEVQRWLEFVQANPDRYSTMQFSPGDQISLESGKFLIVAQLGSGAEGDAYLAETEKALVVIKMFRSQLFYDTAKPDYENGSDLPKILANDDHKLILVLQYREGIPVHFLTFSLRTWPEVRDKIGLSKETIDKIKADWKIWSEVHPRVHDTNAVYSFRNHSFSIIDPH